MKVSTPRMDKENEKKNISPNNARNIPKVMGISSGKMKMRIPVTNGMAATKEGILKLKKRIPKVTKYPPAIRYRKSG